MNRRNLAILGCGSIAARMAETVSQMHDVTLYAVASRDLQRANAFAAKWNAKKTYGSYQELVQDSAVDLVYIATPHSHHFDQMKLCIENGKAVLCEKAFTRGAAEAREIRKLSREKGVFVTEALWPRYMPSRKMIDELLAEHVIGNISMVTCNLSYDIDHVERVIRPELAGGALLDIGIYGLNFLLMHLGNAIDRIDSSVKLTETGVDGQENLTLYFENGIMGCSSHSIYGLSDRKGIFTGELGFMIVENINNPEEIQIYDRDYHLIRRLEVPKQITGYEYEVRECFEAIEAGRTESWSMPLDETIFLQEIMDGLRKNWGMIR